MTPAGVRFPPLTQESADLVGRQVLHLCAGSVEAQLAAFDLQVAPELPPEDAARKRLELGIRALKAATRDSEGHTIDEDFFWRLPVGTRLHALILLGLELAPSRGAWLARCPHDACGAPLELDLPLEELARLADDVGAPTATTIMVGGEAIRIPPPTSEDLRRWNAEGLDELDVLRDLLGSSEVDSEIPAGAGAIMDAALSERDPLVDCRFETPCPECGAAVELEVDLESAVIDNLRRAQTELLGEVDRLAQVYHWGEEEILGLPAWRRRRYLSLIDGEAAWAI